MKRWNSGRTIRAFTLIELLVVLAIIAVLCAIIVPIFDRQDPSPRNHCMANLKQVGLGSIMWSSDHRDRFPWQVPATDGGTLETSDRGHVAPSFQALATYLPDPRIFLCPVETTRRAAASYAGLTNANTSYFIHLDASANVSTNASIKVSTSALSGDRNLELDGKPVKPGLVLWSTNSALGWTRDLHAKKTKLSPGGNVLFTDGHVEWYKTNLSAAFQSPGLAASRLAVP